AFFRQRRRAETNLHPANGAIVIESGVFHVVEIFIPGDRTSTQCPLVNGSGERRGPSRLNACRNKGTHIGSISSNIEEEATWNCAVRSCPIARTSSKLSHEPGGPNPSPVSWPCHRRGLGWVRSCSQRLRARCESDDSCGDVDAAGRRQG